MVISKVSSAYIAQKYGLNTHCCGAGIVAQLQSSLHKERQHAQSLEEAATRLSSEQQRVASSRDSALLAQRVRCVVTRGRMCRLLSCIRAKPVNLATAPALFDISGPSPVGWQRITLYRDRT